MRRSTKPNDANKLQSAVSTKFFFFEIKIEILFDKREIHVKTHNNPVSINTGEQRPILQKIKYATK